MRFKAASAAALLCLSLAAGGALLRPAPPEIVPRMISAHVDYQAPDGTQYRWISDVQGYRSTAEMVRAADVVVVGTVVAKDGVRVNLERDPLNPEVEHPTRRILATPYTVEVEEYLKGEDQRQIRLLQPSHLSLPDSPALVEDRTQRPYEVGERYVLFLKRGVLGDYYGTIGEPGAFIIRDGKAEVNSGFAEPHAWYRPTPASKFIAALRKQGRAAGR